MCCLYIREGIQGGHTFVCKPSCYSTSIIIYYPLITPNQHLINMDIRWSVWGYYICIEFLFLIWTANHLMGHISIYKRCKTSFLQSFINFVQTFYSQWDIFVFVNKIYSKCVLVFFLFFDIYKSFLIISSSLLVQSRS